MARTKMADSATASAPSETGKSAKKVASPVFKIPFISSPKSPGKQRSGKSKQDKTPNGPALGSPTSPGHPLNASGQGALTKIPGSASPESPKECKVFACVETVPVSRIPSAKSPCKNASPPQSKLPLPNGAHADSRSDSPSASTSGSNCSADVRQKTVIIPNGNAVRPGNLSMSPSSPETKRADQPPRRQSPGCHSLASTSSMATVVAVDIEPPPADKQKPTLGEIVHDIEVKAKSLLTKTDFTTSVTLPALQFLAHQSRYSSDVNVRKRIISKLVENRVLDIFFRVLKSVNSVDYLAPVKGSENVGDKKPPLPPPDGKSDDNVVENGLDSPRDRTTSVTSRTDLKLEADKLASDALKNLRIAITLMVHTSEKSPSLCDECVRRGVIIGLLDDMADARFMTADLNKDQNKTYIVKGYLGILHNIIRFCGEARDVFRDAGAVKILQHFVKSALLMIKTKALILLSFLMSESENDIINSSDKNLGFMVKMLQSAMESDSHYSKRYGYWAVEAAAGLNRLACCESNKERMANKGVIPLYGRLLDSRCSEEEQLVAARGLWILAFNEECRNMILDCAASMRGLESLEKNSSREEIKRTVRGAAWVIQGRLAAPKGADNTSQPRMSPLAAAAVRPKENGPILISYQGASKPIVMNIREKLKSAGYKVMMDIEGGCGHVGAMAEVVERSSVILACMTQKYKDSPMCRTEVEYGDRLGRGLIALKVQNKYNPDGWLNPILGNKLQLDLSNEENIQKMLPNLLRELGSRGWTKPLEPLEPALCSHSPAVSQNSLAASASSASPPVPDSLSKVGQWSIEDVARWLRQNDLGQMMERFRLIDGELLVEIRKMQKFAPESFYNSLKADLRLDFVTSLKFTRALDKL